MRRVVIIGAGIAAMSAALTLAEQGWKSVLVSPMISERAQSVMAEGGINAALDTMGEGDSVRAHFCDTMAAGCGLADPNAVADLTAHGPETVRALASLGVPFHTTASGDITLRPFGGQKKRRTAFVRSSTGRQIVTALARACRREEKAGRIVRLSHHWLQQILTAEGRCTGCIVRDGRMGRFDVLAGPVLLASGGLNGLFGKTTGSVQNTGAATALAYAVGAACGNLEMIQYHPTTVPISGKRVLISEAARGEGGRLFLRRGGEKWYFMEEKYPELKNLMPRDVVSWEIEQVCRETGEDRAWLDLTGVDPAVFDERLEDLRAFCLEFLHLDPQKEPVPVYPGIHYFMGGVYVDRAHRSTLPGLYAAGECACQYHGANRLGGNSLLGAVYGGRRAAETLLRDDGPPAPPPDAQARWTAALREIENRPGRVSCRAAEGRMNEAMNDCLGIRRCEEELAAGAKTLADLSTSLAAGYDPSAGAPEQYLLERRLILARAMVDSARARRESRGAQYRTDYPKRDDGAFQKTTLARWRAGKTEITFADIPKEETP